MRETTGRPRESEAALAQEAKLEVLRYQLNPQRITLPYEEAPAGG